MFPTEFGPSFTAHLSLIAGNTDIKQGPIAEVDAPNHIIWGCDAPPGTRSFTLNVHRVERFNGPFPCFTRFPTLADVLDAAGVSWKYYASPLSHIGGKVWSEFSSIRAVRYGPDWKNVISPQTRILDDVPAGTLADVSWITPDWKDSDHTGSGYDDGPSWVASIVNAIGESSYWDSTAIVVLWDDWGGWYDNVPPPQLDYRGLGIRVGCIIVSPYARIAPGAKAGYVSHTQYEYGSILKFVEQVFNLPPIGPSSAGFTDTRAISILDSFDFTQAPRAFTAIPSRYPESHFRFERPSFIPPDSD
jgi:phospholipase C